MRIDIPELIQHLPINVLKRVELERAYILTTKSINRMLNRSDANDSHFYPLVRNNRLYGDEYLLRKYSGVDEYLYAIIEHGLYFGNNRSKVGLEHEWELGCILTYGDYRRNLINCAFPEYFCETIGPLIHYAEMDQEYYDHIQSTINPTERTLLFFPAHGSDVYSPEYDKELLIREVLKFSEEYDFGNILFCVYITDINIFEQLIDRLGVSSKIKIVTCGNRYSEKFLCRQKAIITIADLTMSNSLGTHLGYCIYLGKPHVMKPVDFYYSGKQKDLEKDFGKSNRSDNVESDIKTETTLFQELFGNYSQSISDAQRELCDYYWGFSHIKTRKEIAMLYTECHNRALKFVGGGYYLEINDLKITSFASCRHVACVQTKARCA